MPRPRNQNLSVSATMSGLKAEYALSQEGRFRRRRPGVTGMGGPGDFHYGSESAFTRGREYVRAMHRDDAVIGATTRKCVQQHIQTGFRLDPQTGDKKLDLDLWQRWNDWSTAPDQCDAAGEMEFADMESSVLESMIVDGDVLGLPLEAGQLQLVEADRCRTPTKSKKTIVLGVELDELRRRTRFYFAKDAIGVDRSYQRLYDFDAVAARDADGERQVFHVYNPDRFTLTRGVTAYKAIVDIAGMFEDTNFALLVKQQAAAFLVAFLERSESYQGDVVTGARATETQSDGSSMTIEELATGTMIKGARGEKLHVHGAQIPSHETMAHLKFLLQVIGINLGMPLPLVLLDASETNFSGWRGAMDMARLGFRCNQQSLVRRFHKPVYRWKLRQWIAEDPALARAAEKLGPAFFAHRWHTPTWPYIEPEKDARANAVRLNTLQASERQIAAENGRDYDQIVDEHISDRRRTIYRAIRAAQQIEKKTGVSVHWRDVLNQDVPKGGVINDTIEEENTTGGAKKPAAAGA